MGRTPTWWDVVIVLTAWGVPIFVTWRSGRETRRIVREALKGKEQDHGN